MQKKTNKYNFFPSNIYKIRKEKGLSQAELGKIFKLSQRSIANYETGYTPSQKNKIIFIAREIEKLYNLPINSLGKDGRLIIEKDFEEIVTSHASAQDLQNRSVTDKADLRTRGETSEISTSDQRTTKYEPYELELLDFFRILKHGSKTISLSEATVNRIKEANEIMGVDDEVQYSFLKFITQARRKYGTGQKTGGDKKEGN